MNTTAWRITKRKHARSSFTGEGARLYGGRWNSPGTAMVYVAESQALAVLEVLVHLDSTALLERYVLIRVDFDTSQVEEMDRSRLSRNWREDPAPSETQRVGDRWVAAGSSLALRVPSTLVPGESNFLLNPRHPDFKSIATSKAIPFQFDPRLGKYKLDEALMNVHRGFDPRSEAGALR